MHGLAEERKKHLENFNLNHPKPARPTVDPSSAHAGDEAQKAKQDVNDLQFPKGFRRAKRNWRGHSGSNATAGRFATSNSVAKTGVDRSILLCKPTLNHPVRLA